MGLAELRAALGGEVWIGSDANAVAKEGAKRFAAAAQRAIAARGRFAIALAGGRTPRATYELLADAPYAAMIDWRKLDVFFGDERAVGPESPRSNYRMAREALLDRVPIDPARVRRMEGERELLKAARDYEMALRAAGLEVQGTPESGLQPRLDLVLLGMGPDGHTASLFPDSPALGERWRLVTENPVEKLDEWRLTMTLPMLNAAREVIFLISGAEKAKVLKDISREPGQSPERPVTLVQPVDGKLVWLLDRAATT